MAHVRREFTDNQKAIIFARDRATCCFSGANLWLLDSPLRPAVDSDWVDHVLPSARGGSNRIDNGVCASSTYNAKKRHNTADSFYLFREGIPTAGYYELFGTLSKEQEARLKRLEALAVEDWFLNRSIVWVLEAMRDRCDREFYDKGFKRDSIYWLNAAYRKLMTYQKRVSSSSLEERGIVSSKNEVVGQWLELRTASCIEHLYEISENLFPLYRENYTVWAAYFWGEKSLKELTEIYEKAVLSRTISPDVRDCIISDFRLRTAQLDSAPNSHALTISNHDE